MTNLNLEQELEVVNKKLARLEADGDDANPMSVEHWERVRLELVCKIQLQGSEQA